MRDVEQFRDAMRLERPKALNAQGAESARCGGTISVSMVSSAIDTQTRDFDAHEVIDIIRSGRNVRTRVEAIRRIFRHELAAHGDYKRAKTAITEEKKRLPGVLWSGTFTERANDKLVHHSGLLCADLDNLGSELNDAREKLLWSPHLWALFLSPSDDGLKAVFRVPADRSKHSGSFRAVEKHVKELVGVQIDESCKDVARLCFLTYDPEVFHNPNAVEIKPLPEPEKPRSVNGASVDLSARQRIVNEILVRVDWESETSGFTTCPGQHLHTTGNGARDCKIDLDQVPTAHCFHNSCRGILDGVNHEIRSRIGKVEHTDSKNRKGERANHIQSANAENTPGDQSEDPIESALKSSGLAGLKAGASMTAVELAVRGLASLLADADEIRRATVREAALKKLDEIGISAPAKLLDAALQREKRTENETELILFKQPEPWPTEVDGAELLDEIVSVIRRYVFLAVPAAHATALWILHTWVLAAFDISALLAIVSAMKRSGKTTLLEVVGMLVPRSLSASNITAAALFRAIEKFEPVLLIDEADTFLAGNDELRGVLNAGHRRSSAFVIRTVGDNHEPKQFRTWGAKIIALIGKLSGTLEDRSIVIEMRRRTLGETVDRFRSRNVEEICQPLRSKALRWASDVMSLLRSMESEVPPELNDRAADNWRPLITIADCCGGTWSKRATEAAKALSADTDEAEGSALVELLQEIRELFEWRDRITSAQLAEYLAKQVDKRWADWRNGKPITPRQIAKLLSPLKIKPTTIRMDTDTAKGYLMEAFGDAFSRYLPGAVRHTVTNKQDQSLAPDFDSSQNGDVTDRKVQLTARIESDVTDVTDRQWESPESEFLREEFEERAAIMEFDGGLSRGEAERAACTLVSMRDRSHRGTDESQRNPTK